jgi:two-component system sensor histidine kinase RpfC
VLDTDPTAKHLANAIHAANAHQTRDDEDGTDLTDVLKRERRSLKILVADDNLTNQAIISQLLASAGHSVLVASDGEEALDLYEHQVPDVAILDFNMPNRNGLEVIQAIRVMERPGDHLPTIILSASVTPEAKQRAHEAGADQFVGKPFDAAELLQSIDLFAERIREFSPSQPKIVIAKVTAASKSNVLSIHDRVGIETKITHLDSRRLTELEDIARDAEFMTVLIRGFKTDVESLEDRIDMCLASRSTEPLSDLLHALKGAAVGIGAVQLSIACDNMSRIPSTRTRDLLDAHLKMRTCIATTFAQLDGYARAQHHVSL